ncbi:hypothetical protein G9272_37575 [Streptomyces asoensis]|uniref:Uncharacterized protein n=1 Tax=Streptomyces asoensis TaxID=249586 RepID=A0A6M4WZ04_9ACTN|nr:hypothetical protein [Streptomyces asoensis]QJT05319.1 hypothetical protein G9272_37575 [Streptomyces asoensis]
MAQALLTRTAGRFGAPCRVAGRRHVRRRRRETARALVSSPLPLPTTTRPVLPVLVVGAGASFATRWCLVLGKGNWQNAQLACLPGAEGTPDAVLARFAGCVNDLRLAQSGGPLTGPPGR